MARATCVVCYVRLICTTLKKIIQKLTIYYACLIIQLICKWNNGICSVIFFLGETFMDCLLVSFNFFLSSFNYRDRDESFLYTRWAIRNFLNQAAFFLSSNQPILVLEGIHTSAHVAVKKIL